MAFNVSYIFSAVDRFTAVAGKIRGSMESVQQTASNVSKKIDGFGKGVRDVGKDLMPVSLGLGALAGFALNASAKMETLQTSFRTMTGSGENAKKLMTDLRDFGARTPFEIEGIGQATKQLLAFGVGQKDIIPTLTNLGDIASGAGVPLSDMAAIFGKMKSKGKAMTEELLQMSDRGIPIVDVLAKGFKVTKEKIFDMASKGKISFEVMQKALAKMTGQGGIFQNQMEEQSKTLAGRWSTMSDSITNSLTTIGDTLVETFDLKTVLQDSANYLDGLTARVQAFVKENPGITKFALGVTALVAVLAPLLIVIGFIASGIAALAPVLTLVVGIFSALSAAGAVFSSVVYSIAAATNLAVLPFLLIVLAVVAVIAALYLLWDNWDQVSSWIGDGIESLVAWFSGMAKMLSEVFTGLGAMATKIFEESPLGKLISFAGSLMGGDSKTTIDVNINDKGGNVGSVNSSSSGSGTTTNVGKNM